MTEHVRSRVRSRRTQLSWISKNLVSMQRIVIIEDSRAEKEHDTSHSGEKTGKKVEKISIQKFFVLPKLPKRPTEELVQTHENSCHSASKFGR